MSSCDSSIFIFATAGGARWPVTPQKEAALRAAIVAIPRNFKRASRASKGATRSKKQRKR